VSEEDSPLAASAIRELNGQRFWHQGPVSRDVTYVDDRPIYGARFHVAGGAPAWYASSTEQGAWAELFRHYLDDGVDPFEVRRRVARVRVDALRILDLTNESARHIIGITVEDLSSDDYGICQRIAQRARVHGLDGILSPSAALEENTTLVVFARAIENVIVEQSRVSAPPPRLADLIASIRLHRNVPAAVRDLFRYLSELGSESVRRHRLQR
jgi:RES domain-containing protein